MKEQFLAGRGAQKNHPNRFSKYTHVFRDEFLEFCAKENEPIDSNKTQHLEVFPKSIVNKITSPDVGMSYSLNPYQGCEHGCVYCYARSTHEFWGYSAGLDFERQVLVKKNAPKLLEDFIKRRSWKATPIVMSGNTDCYQPAEKRFKLTRACLEVFLKYRHPVSIITKNALIQRDLDLVKDLADLKLINVSMSTTSLSEKTRRILEPRTTTIKKRFQTIEILREIGVPVNVMIAPIIPSINSHEIISIAKEASNSGAQSIGHTVVRLNGAIGELFSDWLNKTLPDQADKVLNQIKECHGGTLNDSRFGTRMKGEGKIAKQINDMMKIAKRKYFNNSGLPKLDYSLHANYKDGQLKLF